MTSKISKTVIMFLCMALFSSCASLQDTRQPEYSQRPLDFRPPSPTRTVLPNKMVLYLLPDRELPLVSISVIVRTGSMYEPSDKTGLALLTGQLLRTGGTTRLSADELDEALDFSSIKLSSGIGTSSGSVSMNFLSDHTEEAFQILRDVLRYPAFEEKTLKLAKLKLKESIIRKEDKPDSILNAEFAKLIYSHDSPYAREITLETIDNISRDDLMAFHQTYFKPNNIILGVTGDFEPEQIKQYITRLFADWPDEQVNFPQVNPVENKYKKSVNFIRKKLTQSRILMGHLSIKKQDQDFFALSVMNDILGGQFFTSRLFRDVRTKKGLAYSVGSEVSPGYPDLGYFVAFAQTKSESTVETISTILDNIKKITQQPVSQEELDIAKDAFLNSYVFNFSQPSYILTTQMSLEYYDLPGNYLETVRDKIEALTTDDIYKAARKHIHPDKMTILVLGDDVLFHKQLSTLGDVSIITRPKPGRK